MRARLALAGVLAAGLAPPALAELAEGERLLAAHPPALVEALFHDRVVLAKDGEPLAARGLVIFAKPVERVFQLLSQTSRQLEFRPDLAGIETLESLPDGTLEEHRIRILFLDIRYHLRNRLDRERRLIRWELAPGFEHDLERVEGSWELYPLPQDRTLGVFETRVEVGPAMPSFLQDYATRKSLPGTLERCRRWVDGDGHIDD
jgi:ribosome-associated toxin RatA of RatAB toxin-antitoxin module